jgi:hypothetical protein
MGSVPKKKARVKKTGRGKKGRDLWGPLETDSDILPMESESKQSRFER